MENLTQKNNTSVALPTYPISALPPSQSHLLGKGQLAFDWDAEETKLFIREELSKSMKTWINLCEQAAEFIEGSQHFPQEQPQKMARATKPFGSEVFFSHNFPISNGVKDVWEDSRKPQLVWTPAVFPTAVWKWYSVPRGAGGTAET